MSAEYAEIDFGDGDGGEPSVDPLDVLMRFSQLVEERHGPFKIIVREMLSEAVMLAAEGECNAIPKL